MPILHEKSQYLIARGRVYFAPYDASEKLTGEIDLGNCPGVAITIATEKAEHFSSQGGLREKDGAWVVQVDRTGTLKLAKPAAAIVGLGASVMAAYAAWRGVR